jgi:hypothetical protein
LLPGNQPSKRSFAGCLITGISVFESTDSRKISYLPFSEESGKSKAICFSSVDIDKFYGKEASETLSFFSSN